MLDIPFVIAGAYLYNKSNKDVDMLSDPVYNYFMGGLFWPYLLPLSAYHINKINKAKLHKKYMKDDEYAEAYRERERIKAELEARRKERKKAILAMKRKKAEKKLREENRRMNGELEMMASNEIRLD